MLLAAAFTLLGLFRLATAVASLEVAVAATILTAIYPVFFAQSSLVHLDLAAAGFTFWGSARLRKRPGMGDGTLVLARQPDQGDRNSRAARPVRMGRSIALLLPARDGNSLPGRQTWNPAWLAGSASPARRWYGFHYWRTGFVFGNPEFFRYNVEATLNPLRILLALLVRLWQILGYFRLLMLTLATLFAMWLPPLRDPDGERPRIAPGRPVRHALGDCGLCIRHGAGGRRRAGALHAARWCRW